jgi:hypothetical protein
MAHRIAPRNIDQGLTSSLERLLLLMRKRAELQAPFCDNNQIVEVVML